MLERFEIPQNKCAPGPKIAREDDALLASIFLNEQLNARRAEHVARFSPDGLDSRSNLYRFLIRHGFEALNDSLGIFGRVKRFLRRFAGALALAIAAFCVAGLDAG